MRETSRSVWLLAAALLIGVAAIGLAISSRPESQTAQGASEEVTPTPNPPVADSVEPELVLPADQRIAWISMWQKTADCMQGLGFEEFPDAPQTFGDGKTAAPALYEGGTAVAPAAFQEALKQCPFDYSGLSEEAFLQAWNELATRTSAAPG